MLYGEFGPPTDGLPSPTEIKIWSFEKEILDPKCPALELMEFVLKTVWISEILSFSNLNCDNTKLL